MKPGSLTWQITQYLQANHAWHSKGALTAEREWRHQKGRRYGARFLPETVGRALRSLEEDSVIAAKADGISVQYKWIPHAMRRRYIPTSRRPLGWEHVLFKLDNFS